MPLSSMHYGLPCGTQKHQRTAPLRTRRPCSRSASHPRRHKAAANRSTQERILSNVDPLSQRAGRKILNTADSPSFQSFHPQLTGPPQISGIQTCTQRAKRHPPPRSRRQKQQGNARFKILPCRPRGMAPVRPGRAALPTAPAPPRQPQRTKTHSNECWPALTEREGKS